MLINVVMRYMCNINFNSYTGYLKNNISFIAISDVVMNIYSLYVINYLKWGDVCKSLLFLLVNLVTVSLHCSNYTARRHQIHTSCITKDKGV